MQLDITHGKEMRVKKESHFDKSIQGLTKLCGL